MRVSFDTKELRTGITDALRATSARSNLPILSYVLLETGTNSVRFKATDLDTWICVDVPARVYEEGAVALPARSLADYVSRIQGGETTLEVTDGKCNIRSGGSRYNMLHTDADTFPILQEQTGDSVTLPAADFLKLLNQTTFSAATDVSRSLLMGVLFEFGGNQVTAVATDTHRLSKQTVPLLSESGAAQPGPTVVPASSLRLLPVMIGKYEGDITMTVCQKGSRVDFTWGHHLVSIRVIDGQFPNWAKVIPVRAERKISVDFAEFREAVRLLQVVGMDKTDGSEKAILDFKGEGKDIVTLEAQAPAVGKVNAEVPALIEGEDIAIGINAKYLLQALESMPSGVERVNISVLTALSPIVVRYDKDESWLHVLMPMQI